MVSAAPSFPLVAETVAEQGSNSDATGGGDFEEAAARTGRGQRDRRESSRETSGQSSHGKGDASVETAAYRDHQGNAVTVSRDDRGSDLDGAANSRGIALTCKKGCVDRAESVHLVVSHDGGKTRLSRNTIASAGRVMKYRRSSRPRLGSPRVKHRVGFALPGDLSCSARANHAGQGLLRSRGPTDDVEAALFGRLR